MKTEWILTGLILCGWNGRWRQSGWQVSLRRAVVQQFFAEFTRFTSVWVPWRSRRRQLMPALMPDSQEWSLEALCLELKEVKRHGTEAVVFAPQVWLWSYGFDAFWQSHSDGFDQWPGCDPWATGVEKHPTDSCAQEGGMKVYRRVGLLVDIMGWLVDYSNWKRMYMAHMLQRIRICADRSIWQGLLRIQNVTWGIFDCQQVRKSGNLWKKSLRSLIL